MATCDRGPHAATTRASGDRGLRTSASAPCPGRRTTGRLVGRLQARLRGTASVEFGSQGARVSVATRRWPQGGKTHHGARGVQARGPGRV